MTRSGTPFSDLTTSVRDAATVRRVFGEPVTVDGVTIVPAAAVRGAGGGGSGSSGKGDEGEGGGFVLSGRPVGAYVIHGGTVKWRPAVDLDRLVTAAAVVLTGCLIFRGRGRR